MCGSLLATHVRDLKPYDGHLYVTTERLVWVPWQSAVTRGAVPFVIPLPEVHAADVAERGSTRGERWRDKSLRRRLRVTKLSGQDELFVVWRPQEAADLVNRARQGLP